MQIPNLSTASKTDPAFPPHCATVGAPKRKPGGMLHWTLDLRWELDENNVRTVNLPDCFGDTDRTKMLRAFEGSSGAMKAAEDPMMQITAALHVAIGAERLPILLNAACIVKRIELSASEGTAMVRTLLVVETGRDRAPEITDAIDADVHVTVQQQLGLFVAKREAAVDGDGNAVNEEGDVVPEDDLPPEAGSTSKRKTPPAQPSV